MAYEQWYGVKCLVEHRGLTDDVSAHVYEERIVIFRADTFDEAIGRAEREVREYAEQNCASYLGYCNAYKIEPAAIVDGTEVYSLMREVHAPPGEFITRYFDDGTDKHR